MTSTSTSISRQAPAPFARRGSRQRSGTDPRFVLAAALFVAVLIATAVAVAMAAATIPDIGSLYITVT